MCPKAELTVMPSNGKQIGAGPAQDDRPRVEIQGQLLNDRSSLVCSTFSPAQWAAFGGQRLAFGPDADS